MERTLDPARLGDHLDRLYRAAWALCGSRADAEDLVQETYARVLARPRVLRNEDDLGYLLRALRNTFLNQKRTESRRLRPSPLPDDLDFIADPRASEPQAAPGSLMGCIWVNIGSSGWASTSRQRSSAGSLTTLVIKDPCRPCCPVSLTVVAGCHDGRRNLARSPLTSPPAATIWA